MQTVAPRLPAYENEGEREQIVPEHPDYRKLHGRRSIIHTSQMRNTRLQNSEELGPGSRVFHCRGWSSASVQSDSQSWFSCDRFPVRKRDGGAQTRISQGTGRNLSLYRGVIRILVTWETRPVKGERRGLRLQNPLFILAIGELNYGEHLDFIKHLYFTKEK